MEIGIVKSEGRSNYMFGGQPILCLEYVSMILNCKQEDVPESLSMCMTEESMGHGSVEFQWDSSIAIRFLDPKMGRTYRPHKHSNMGHVTYAALRKVWENAQVPNRFWLTIRRA
jgi:hypothetical protein